MSEESKGRSQPSSEPVPEAVVQKRSGISIVWLIPIVAAVIGGWLAYKAYSEQGPVITITFKSAEGLEAGKTKVKFKEVEVGKVEKVELQPGLNGVVATVQMVKGSEKYLNDKTRFWVVSARIAGGQVSGLSTLLSGAYIGVDPVAGGEPTTAFKGLEIPPVVTTDQPGRHFNLQADELGSLEVGAPVYFREFRVGEVVSYELKHRRDNSPYVDVQIFIREPHDEQVHANTRFWNASGVDVKFGATGLEVRTGTLTSLLIGGIAFDNPQGFDAGAEATAETVFKLHASRNEAFAKSPRLTTQWVLMFTGSVRGLEVGAPVELRGIKLGEVLDYKLIVDIEKASLQIPVLIELAPERIELLDDFVDLPGDIVESERRQFWDRLVAKGFRAQLKTGSLLTGALFIDMDFYPDAEPQPIVWEPATWGGEYPQLPTVPTAMEEIRTAVTGVLEKIESLPLDKMSSDIQQTLEAFGRTAVQLETLIGNLNAQVAPALSAALTDARTALKSADGTLDTARKSIGPQSNLQQELNSMLRELTAAARSIRVLADYLERHPEALIQGKGRGR